MDRKPTDPETGRVNDLLERISELESLLAKKSNGSNEVDNPEFTYRSLFENVLHEVHVWRLVRNEDGTIKTWRLVDANPAALNAWKKTLSEIVGKTTNEIFGIDATSLFMPVVEKVFRDMKPHSWEQEFAAMGQILHMVTVPFGELFLSTGFDITEQKTASRKQDELIIELKEALAEIRTLRGLLPICACCKKIRETDDQWVHLEKYLTENTHADFTHSYCPECYEEAMRELHDQHDRSGSDYKLAERVKELNCFYELSKIMRDHSLSFDEMMNELLQLLPPAWQYPDFTCASITVKGKKYETENYSDTEWKLSSTISCQGNSYGSVEVRYLKDFPIEDEGVFLREERKLIDGITERLGIEIYSRELRIDSLRSSDES